jgi:putative ABC transport system permease protein
MWQYVFLMLRRQPGKSALASSGFLLAACALILLSATTQTTAVQGNQIISQSWRSSYDLVVLPPQANIPSKQTIPGDMLEGYDGGISLQQYQQIKNLAGVEVAAPIAFVGYVQMPVPPLEFLPQSLPDGYYRIDLALTAFNGQHKIVERTVSETYYHLSSCSDNSFSIDKLGSALDKQHIFVDCSPDSISSAPQVDTGTFLLAAIDPTAENQLVHLDKSITGGRMLTSQDDVHRDDNPQLASVKACTTSQPSSCTVSVPNYAIPVLFHTQLPGQITLKGTFTRVAHATLDPQTVIAKGGSAYLTRLPGQQILFNGVIPLAQSNPALFSGTTFVLNGNSLQPKVSSPHGRRL